MISGFSSRLGYSYTERGLLYKRVFHISGLMRMRLLPDASKMVICTTGGYIMVIHNLNLETLPTDLLGFKVRQRFIQTCILLVKYYVEFSVHFAAEHVQTDADKRDHDTSSCQVHAFVQQAQKTKPYRTNYRFSGRWRSWSDLFPTGEYLIPRPPYAFQYLLDNCSLWLVDSPRRLVRPQSKRHNGRELGVDLRSRHPRFLP